MGRTSHEAIGRWLPGRTTIVITRRPEAIVLPDDGKAVGFAVASFTEALELACSLDDTVFIAGGGSVYNPADGRTYRGTITMTGDNSLRLRGCIVAPLCKTQTWTRIQ